MKIAKLLNELNEVLNETQIEYVDDVVAVKEGTYEGEAVAEIVLNNLDQFTEDELVSILNNYEYYTHCGANRLFPSMYNAENGPYPVKLAQALSKSKENEDLTDIFNIFYAHHSDLETWNDAAQVWQQSILNNFDEFIANNPYVDTDYEDYVTDMLNDIEKAYPEFVEQVKQKLQK